MSIQICILGLFASNLWAQEPTGETASVPSPIVEEDPILALLSPATQDLYRSAVAAEAAGELRKAQTAYGMVVENAPGFTPAMLGLARVRAARGDQDGAMRIWERLPGEASAMRPLALAQLEKDPPAAVDTFRRLLRLQPGDLEATLGLAQALCAVRPEEGLHATRTYLAMVDEVDGALLLDFAENLREGSYEEDALVVLEEGLPKVVDPTSRAVVTERIERIRIERAARVVAAGGDRPLSAGARERLDEARKIAATDPTRARKLVEAVVAENDRSAEARGALGNILLQLGEIEAAEVAWSWAVALDPDQAEWRARLGSLLANSYAGRRNAEAAEHLALAARLRPGRADFQLAYGRVLVSMGRWSDAQQALQRCLEAEPDEEIAADAHKILEDLQRTPPPPPTIPSPELSSDPEVPASALQAARIARVYIERGELERAAAELVIVVHAAPNWWEADNLKAALAMRQGDQVAAEAAWRRALLSRPDQPWVRLSLAELIAAQGRRGEALAELQRAAQDGAVDAEYSLARIAWEEGRLVDARTHLDAYFAATPGGLSLEPARNLRERLEYRLRMLSAGGVGLVSGAVFGLGLWWRWRRLASNLERVAQRAPELTADLVRTLGALRHEVLKHNTNLLDEVAHALEHGDHSAIRFTCLRLFGPPGAANEPSADHVFARFDAYMERLGRLARQAGLRLDVRRDVALEPLVRGMEGLRAMESVLRRPERADARAPDRLRHLSELLNRTAYKALGAEARRLSALVLDEELISAVDARVRQEPSFQGVVLPDLELEMPKGRVVVQHLRGDLEDVLANLLRNAANALLDQGGSRLGMRVEEEEDEITGMEAVSIRVLDDAPGRITESMIRGREAGRGLGLVVDLVTRHDGSVTVEERANERKEGWTKAVVVRLRRAEEGRGRGGE